MTRPRPRIPLADRWATKVQQDDVTGCWNWTGGINGNGYGQIQAGGQGTSMVGAHRVSYELHVGPIPDGLHIDHLCRNRACVNPDHLEAVPARVNILRGNGFAARNARKTLCPQGHPLEGSNLGILRYRDGRRWRWCRACREQRRIQKRGLS